MKQTSNVKTRTYPFPAASSMAEMMEFVRHPAWRQTINIALLKKMRIATNNEAKVPAALHFLGVIDEHGVPTEEFDHLKEDYQPTLARLVKASYSELFDAFPAELITRERLLSFFGKTGSKPDQMAERRARFFVWVCNEAGIELRTLDKEV